MICFTIACIFDFKGSVKNETHENERRYIKKRKDYECSQRFGWSSLLAIMLASIITALPNYLAKTDIDSIVPFCAEQFYQLVNRIAGIYHFIILSFFIFIFYLCFFIKKKYKKKKKTWDGLTHI